MTTPTIVIDPGHGGTDPGAMGYGEREKDYALTYSKKIGYLLEKEFVVDVKYTRETDKSLTLIARSNFSDSCNPVGFYSIHMNANADITAHGYEDYIYNGCRDNSTTDQMRSIVHSSIMDVLEKHKVKNRGKKKANYSVLRETKAKAMLLEVVFISNKENNELMKNANFQDDFCKAVAYGIAKAHGLVKKPIVKPTPAKVVKAATPKKTALHRVIVDGKQINAFSEVENILGAVERYIGEVKEIKIQKV